MMCPSVWLSLDVLADRQNRTNEGRPAMAQFIDNWLDKLKTNRDAEGGGGNEINSRGGCGDEYSLSNVQFAMGVNRDGSVTQKDVDEEGKEVVMGGNKKRKKKKGKVRKKEAELKILEETVMQELKPLVDCR